MRITKDPEERKQEILDTAMKLFYEKGYEKTSITDIANTIGIAQGLCYRYFPSKESLFDHAIDRYAQQLVDRLTPSKAQKEKPLREIIAEMPISVETKDSVYYGTLHQAENKKFHDQLALKMCEKLVPIVFDLINSASEKGEIQVEDLETTASFCVYGQLGILLNGQYSAEEKERKIRKFLSCVLKG